MLSLFLCEGSIPSVFLDFHDGNTNFLLPFHLEKEYSKMTSLKLSEAMKYNLEADSVPLTKAVASQNLNFCSVLDSCYLLRFFHMSSFLFLLVSSSFRGHVVSLLHSSFPRRLFYHMFYSLFYPLSHPLHRMAQPCTVFPLYSLILVLTIFILYY